MRALWGGALLLLPGWTCGGGGGDVFDAPEDEGIPFDGPPGTAPTGQRFDEVEIEDGCGRTQLAFRLVDEVCGGAAAGSTTLPEPGALAAPMFRDGALVDGAVWAVDGTHLWILDRALTTGGAPARLALTAGVGEAIAIAGTAQGAFIAAGDAGLLEVVGTPEALTVLPRATFGGPALDVDVDEAGSVLVAAGDAGLVLDATGAATTVGLGAPAVAVTVFGPRAYVATCDGLAVVDVASASVLGVARGASWVPAAEIDGINHAPAKDVAVARLDAREIAFVAAGRFGTVGVDVSDPTAPRVLGNCTDITNRAHYASGVKMDAARGLLAIAAGERGVVVEADPLACAEAFVVPDRAPPVSTVDAQCERVPPWEIIENVSWEPPPPGKDPVQVLLVDDIALAFGDARRNALRAVDAWHVPATGGTVDAGLVHVARAQEPRALTGIAAGGPEGARVVAVGGRRGGVFTVDATALLVRDPGFTAEIVGLPAVLADGAVGALDVAMGGTALRVHRAGAAPLEVALPGRVSPRSLALRDDGALVVARADGLAAIDPVDGAVTATPLTRSAALAPAVIAVGDDVIVAAPEWERSLVDGPRGPGALPEHRVFDVAQILDLSQWRHGPPRHTLARERTARRVLEVVVLADRAALLVFETSADGGDGDGAGTGGGFVTVVEGPVPVAPYTDAALTRDRAYLLAHDAARYRSELVTVDVTGPTPTVIAVQGWTGAAVGLSELDGRLYVADADGAVRVYEARADGAALLGVIDLRGAP